MESKIIWNYLSELKDNNNREWYHAHKKDYQEANRQFEELQIAIQPCLSRSHLIHGQAPYSCGLLHNAKTRSSVLSGRRAFCRHVQGCDKNGTRFYRTKAG